MNSGAAALRRAAGAAAAAEEVEEEPDAVAGGSGVSSCAMGDPVGEGRKPRGGSQEPKRVSSDLLAGYLGGNEGGKVKRSGFQFPKGGFFLTLGLA